MGNSISIPYSGFIPGGIKIGTDVVISGITHSDCKRFTISLCAGPTIDTDTAVTFNPRFNDGRVVRNHKQGGSWGVEETNGGMPLHKGHGFNFHMKVEQQGYKITINGKHFCNFHHRIPKERVQYLYIEGDVVISFIQFQGQGGYPTGITAPPPYPGPPTVPTYPGGASYPPVLSYPSYPFPSNGPLYNPPVPLTTPIQGGMYSGKIIYISGIPNPKPNRFTVNLTCGACDSADIGLHFDVRFNFGSNSHNVVVRTHRQGNKYGLEERHQSYFPFVPSVNFEMMILAEPTCFKIAVNNQHFAEFNYRIHPFQKVDYLNVVGDVRLTQVRFQ